MIVHDPVSIRDASTSAARLQAEFPEETRSQQVRVRAERAIRNRDPTYLRGIEEGGSQPQSAEYAAYD